MKRVRIKNQHILATVTPFQGGSVCPSFRKRWWFCGFYMHMQDRMSYYFPPNQLFENWSDSTICSQFLQNHIQTNHTTMAHANPLNNRWLCSVCIQLIVEWMPCVLQLCCQMVDCRFPAHFHWVGLLWYFPVGSTKFVALGPPMLVTEVMFLCGNQHVIWVASLRLVKMWNLGESCAQTHHKLKFPFCWHQPRCDWLFDRGH